MKYINLVRHQTTKVNFILIAFFITYIISRYFDLRPALQIPWIAVVTFLITYIFGGALLKYWNTGK